MFFQIKNYAGWLLGTYVLSSFPSPFPCGDVFFIDVNLQPRFSTPTKQGGISFLANQHVCLNFRNRPIRTRERKNVNKISDKIVPCFKPFGELRFSLFHLKTKKIGFSNTFSLNSSCNLFYFDLDPKISTSKGGLFILQNPQLFYCLRKNDFIGVCRILKV